MKKIEFLIQHLTNKIVRGERRQIFQLILEWPKIVGPNISTITSPLKIVFNRYSPTPLENGKLHLQVSHSVYAFEISMQQKYIIECINGFFQKPLVQSIFLSHRSKGIPLPKKQEPSHPLTQEMLKSINKTDDLELQQLLFSVAQSLKSE